MAISKNISGMGLIGHEKDFLGLERQGILWQEKDQISTPFGVAVVSRGIFEDLPITFCWRYEVDPTSGQRASPRALIFALAVLDIKQVISLNGVAAVNPVFKTGDFVILNDFIDVNSKGEERSYFNDLAKGIFVRMNPPFCPALRTALCQALRKTEIPGYEFGVCYCTQGSRLETPAEVHMLKMFGVDVLNMRVGIEASLCRELEICYASLSFVINYAESTIATGNDVSFEALKVGFDQPYNDMAKFSLLKETISCLQHSIRECYCSTALCDARKGKIVRSSAVEFVLSLYKKRHGAGSDVRGSRTAEEEL